MVSKASREVQQATANFYSVLCYQKVKTSRIDPARMKETIFLQIYLLVRYQNCILSFMTCLRLLGDKKKVRIKYIPKVMLRKGIKRLKLIIAQDLNLRSRKMTDECNFSIISLF